MSIARPARTIRVSRHVRDDTVASDAGAYSLCCDARTRALLFYERLGMQTEGSILKKKGVEHVRMRQTSVRVIMG
jgi:predicted GNAT family N-acyltransferase